MTPAEQALVRSALQFAYTMAGEGFVDAEQMLFDYSIATGDEDWETLAERFVSTPSQHKGPPNA